MSEAQKWLALSSKLLEATQKGSIKWARHRPNVQYYQTTFLGRDLAIVRRPNDGIFLLFVDSTGNIEYEAPQVEGLDDLFNAARRQEANVDEFLEEVLAFNP